MPLEEILPIIEQVATSFPIEEVPDLKEVKRQQRISELKEQLKPLKEELEELEKTQVVKQEDQKATLGDMANTLEQSSDEDKTEKKKKGFFRLYKKF